MDGPIREQSVVLRHQNSGEALGAAHEAIREVHLAQIEQISELERQRDEQRRRERQVQDELKRSGMNGVVGQDISRMSESATVVE